MLHPSVIYAEQVFMFLHFFSEVAVEKKTTVPVNVRVEPVKGGPVILPLLVAKKGQTPQCIPPHNTINGFHGLSSFQMFIQSKKSILSSYIVSPLKCKLILILLVFALRLALPVSLL